MGLSGQTLFIAAVLLVGATLYVLPTWGAFRRHHPRRWRILVANVLLGWTVVAWFACLFWAIRPHRATATSPGP